MGYWIRSESPSTASAYAYDFVDTVNNAFAFVGPIINGLLVVAPAWLERHACNPEKGNLSRDVGKTIELYLLIGATLTQWGAKVFWPRISKKCINHEKDEARFSLMEYRFNEIADATESFVFRYNVMKAISPENPWWLCALVGFRFAWPMVCLVTGWERGSHKHHAREGVLKNHKWKKVIGEALYNGESLSSAFITIAMLIFNVAAAPYMNTNSPQGRNIQLSLIAVTWCVGEVLGGLSVTHPTAWRMVRFTEGTTNSLFYIFSSAASLIACKQINWMNGSGFTRIGMPMCAAIFVVTLLGFSIHAGDDTQKYLFDHREHQKRVEMYGETAEASDQAGTHGGSGLDASLLPS
jgi:hypothetical protein